MIPVILESGVVVIAYATLWFIVALALGRNDVADVAWGLGYVVLSAYLWITEPTDPRDLLLYGLIVVWGLRLSWHIHRRGRGRAEDFRYRKWRSEWGDWFLVRSYLQVFLLQGLLLLLIATPLLLSASSDGPALTWLSALGAGIWLVGFALEAVADRQLAHFKSDPANEGRILTKGLWRYSRHPNYFGEVVLWWGVFLIALPVEHGPWAVISPVLVTTLILFVSGIPMLEKRFRGDPRFEAYRRRTSAFVPLPPKDELREEEP